MKESNIMDGGLLNMDTAASNKTALAFAAGDRVTYVDDNGNAFSALVRRWWGGAGCSAAHLTCVTDEGEVVNINNVPRGDGSVPGQYWQPEGEPVKAYVSAVCELAVYPNIKRIKPDGGPPQFPAEPPVAGYRPLSPENIALMNKVKATFDAVGGVLSEVRYPNRTPDTDDGFRFPADAEEALRHARHHAQTASMWAVRAITRPTSFA